MAVIASMVDQALRDASIPIVGVTIGSRSGSRDEIEHLQEQRVEEAQRSIPLVVEGQQLKVPEVAAGLIVEVKPPPRRDG